MLHRNAALRSPRVGRRPWPVETMRTDPLALAVAQDMACRHRIKIQRDGSIWILNRCPHDCPKGD